MNVPAMQTTSVMTMLGVTTPREVTLVHVTLAMKEMVAHVLVSYIQNHYKCVHTERKVAHLHNRLFACLLLFLLLCYVILSATFSPLQPIVTYQTATQSKPKLKDYLVKAFR